MNSAEILSKPCERQRVAKESFQFLFPGESLPVRTDKWSQSIDPGKYTYLPDIAKHLQKYPADIQKEF